MMIKNVSKVLVLVATSVMFSFSAFAEIKLQDTSELVGAWKVIATTPRLDHQKKKTDETWEFKSDGIFQLSAIDYRLNNTKMTTVTTYEVANGMLKIEKPGGQPGQKKKYYYYRLCKESHPDCANDQGRMTLKGGMEGYYFLIKQ